MDRITYEAIQILSDFYVYIQIIQWNNIKIFNVIEYVLVKSPFVQ